MIVLTALATSAFATGPNAQKCEAYIQLNHNNVVEAHPYGEPNLTAQFGNEGGRTCHDVTVACHITNNDGAHFSNINVGPFASYTTWNNGTRSGFNTNRWGISIPSGQNYNVSFIANVGDYDETVTCKIFVDGKKVDMDKVTIEIIPC